MLVLAALCLSGATTGFAYFAGSGYVNARPSQTIWNQASPIEGLGRISDLAVGYDHALALKADGSVWSWGANTYGQLGRATTTPIAPVPNLPPIAKVIAGSSYSLAIAQDGRVFGWGANGAGQLGSGAVKRQKTAVPVIGATDIVDADAGYGHVLALKNDGTMVAWGGNSYGTLGDGTATSRSTVAPVPGLEDIVDIDAEGLRSAAVRGDGTLFAWGYNYGDWLGVGSTDTSVLQPMPVQDISNVSDVAGGTSHFAAVRSDGKLFTWGSNAEGQLGNPDVPMAFAGVNRPLEVPGLSGIHRAFAGGYANAVLDANGAMKLFGYTNYWLSPFKSNEPLPVPNLSPVQKVSINSYNTMAMIDAPVPFFVNVNPNSVVGGYGTSTVTIRSEEAPSQDVQFDLTSDNANATLPASVTLPAGQNAVTVQAKAPTLVQTPTTATISAQTGGISQGSYLYIDIRRLNFYLQGEVQAGSSGTGSIQINFPAPKNGLSVTLTNHNPSRLTVPETVVIPAGSMYASFPYQTTPNTTDAYVEVTAQQGSRRTTAGVLIEGTWLTSLTIDKSEVFGGQAVKATLTLPQAAPAGGLVVGLLPWPENLQVGSQRRIPEGETSTVIRVGTYPVKEVTGGALTVTYPGSYPKWVTFTILPPNLTSASFTPTTVTGGTNATLKVGLNSLSAGDQVTLYTTSTGVVDLPASVDVAAGAKEATISIATHAVTQNTNVWVRCRLRDKTIWTKLVVTP